MEKTLGKYDKYIPYHEQLNFILNIEILPVTHLRITYIATFNDITIIVSNKNIIFILIQTHNQYWYSMLIKAGDFTN